MVRGEFRRRGNGEVSAITLAQAAQWCGGSVEAKYRDITFSGANNDSRKLTRGQLFVALTGARDGHDFIPQALERGAAAVLCTRTDGTYPAIVVEDVRKAMGDIARGLRQKLAFRVVGITGSVGKSTTKEMVAAVLAKKYRVGKTPVNHNNDIGLPMAILGMEPDVEVAVLEMGMNHFGEIAYLTAIAQPQLAVITNIGTMHIEHLGSQEGILQAKLEILEGMEPDSPIVLNGDDSRLWGQRQVLGGRAVYFGMEEPECQVRGTNYTQAPGRCTLEVQAMGEAFSLRLPLEGRHIAADALAAVAVGRLMEVPGQAIADALADFGAMEGRQEILKVNGCTVIKDCYNAGPESMEAALGVLGSSPGRRIAVLGDMLELGSSTQAQHYRVGRIAAVKCDLVLALGHNAGRVVSGAITGGMRPDRAVACNTMPELAELLRSRAKAGDTILIKGSRGMKMERVLELFAQEK